MKKRNIKKTILADIVFVLDATKSTQPALFSMVDKVEDIGYELITKIRKADFNFGAVIYRDPVDYVYVEQKKPNAKLEKIIDQIYAMNKKIRDEKLLELGYNPDEFDAELNQRKANFDRNKFPFDKNVAIDLKKDLKEIVDELKKVESGGGNDDPEDWVGALDLALHSIHWRKDSKRAIVWISDANAHGKMFCGYDNHNEEEPKMEPLIQEMAQMNIHFVAINLIRNNDRGCERTLKKMRELYQKYGTKTFLSEEYEIPDIPVPDVELWPENVMDGLINSVNRAIKSIPDIFDDSAM